VNEPEAAVWMSRLVKLSSSQGELPDPALIWWKARLLDRQAARARVARPIAIAQSLSLVAAVLTIVVLFAMNWPEIQESLSPFRVMLGAACACCALLTALAWRFLVVD